MSGIVGIVNLDEQPVDQELFAAMTQSLSFRGPDGISIQIRGNVAFGRSLLKTNDENSEQLPLGFENETWITAHARIDGRRALIGELCEHRPHLRSVIRQAPNNLPSDDQLILLAYHVWADRCVDHLIGDFAFAIWDAPERRLFCARDQMGVGQFYYTFKNGVFVFSNTLNCLRLHPLVTSQLNNLAIGDFLLFGLNQDRSTTVFADLQRLPRAHSLILTTEGLRLVEYWKPKADRIRLQSNRDYVEQFKEKLTEAVSDRLRARQVGIALSGGLDSSVVAATAAALLKKDEVSPYSIKAVCVSYEAAFPDSEPHYAGEVAGSVGIAIKYLDGAAINATSSLRTSGYAPEPFDVEPFYVVSDELLKYLSGTSRIALTGWDGDAFMTESPKHLFKELFRTRQYAKLFSELVRYAYFHRRPPPVGVRTWLQRRNRLPELPLYPVWIDDSFAKEFELRERWLEKTAAAPRQDPIRPYALRILDSPDWSVLFSRYDPGSSGLPLEVRHPLIDLRLVEYLLRVPVNPWIVNKYILRDATRGMLPESVRRRPKTPLAGDPSLQLSYSTKVREIDQFLPTLEIFSYVKRDAVPQLAKETDSYRLWVNSRPFSLNQWFKNSFRLDHMPSSEQPDERQSQYSRTHAAGKQSSIYKTSSGSLRPYS